MITVAAGVIQRSGQYLIARRVPGKSLEGCWEFPGGKVDPGETHEECLARELKEELDLDVVVEGYIGESITGEGDSQIRLVAYAARTEQVDIQSKDHDQLKWVSIYEFGDYNFAPADIPIVKTLLMNRIAIMEQLTKGI